MHTAKNSCQPLTVTKFVFSPDTFCFGADADLTVITGYLHLSEDIIKEIKRRRSQAQLGDPVALIAAYDLEHHQLSLYCIDDLDTQCRIRLRSGEAIALQDSLIQSVQNAYHDTPEHLLNLRRMRAHMIPL